MSEKEWLSVEESAALATEKTLDLIDLFVEENACPATSLIVSLSVIIRGMMDSAPNDDSNNGVVKALGFAFTMATEVEEKQ